MPTIAVYDWSVVSHNGSLTTQQLMSDDHANDPAADNYDPGRPSWVGVTYTYTGAPPTQIRISDDDGSFDDGNTDVGAGQVLLEEVTVNGKTYPAGSAVENEFSLIQHGTIEVFVLRIAGDNVGMIPATGLPAPGPGARFSPTQSADGDAANSGTGGTNAQDYGDVICFGAATRIATPDGDRQAGTLRPGDIVLTLDRGPQPLLWVGRRTIEFTGQSDSRRPIRIRAGAFGAGRPVRDLLVSPQHRLFLRGAQPSADALGPAVGFLPRVGVSRVRGRPSITYVHLLLARHELLWADGLICESFFPGPAALLLLSPADREAVLDCWPGLTSDGAAPQDAVRPLLTRRETEDRVMQGQHDVRAVTAAPRCHGIRANLVGRNVAGYRQSA